MDFFLKYGDLYKGPSLMFGKRQVRQLCRQMMGWGLVEDGGGGLMTEFGTRSISRSEP